MYARQHALSHPDKAAIIMGTSGDIVTYAAYEARCDQAARFLRAAGLRRGDHIAVFMENSARMLEIEGAAERTGLYFTLINTYLAPDEVAYILTNSKSRMLFSSAARRPVAEAAAAKCPQLERLLMTGPDEPPRAGSPTMPPSRAVRLSLSQMSRSALPCSIPPARPASRKAFCVTCRRTRRATRCP